MDTAVDAEVEVGAAVEAEIGKYLFASVFGQQTPGKTGGLCFS